MARIQHIAIFAKDNAALAEFYKTTFGLEEVFRQPSGKDREAYYLSDGHINLAILPAGPNRKEGIDHFGLQVEDVTALSESAERNGAQNGATDVPRDGRFADGFILDPVGTRVDISVEGWAVTRVAETPEQRAAAKKAQDKLPIAIETPGT